MNRPDYPAAHSMDTTWFGIDEDGEIAAFETGPEGTIPETIQSLPNKNLFEEWYDLYYSLPETSGGVIEIPLPDKYLAPYCQPADLEKNLKKLLKEEYREDVLVRYSSRNNIASDVLYEDDLTAPALRLSGSLNIVLHPYEPDVKMIQQLVKSNDIIAIAPKTIGTNLIQTKADALYITTPQAQKLLRERYSFLKPKDLIKDDLYWLKAHMGLHIYSYEDDYGFYESEFRPLHTINISAFPNRNELEKSLFRFPNVHFSEVSVIQPFAFSDCETFGTPKEWLGLDESLHIDAAYKDGVLQNSHGSNVLPEEILRIGIWRKGLPPPILNDIRPYRQSLVNNSGGLRSFLNWLGFGKR